MKLKIWFGVALFTLAFRPAFAAEAVVEIDGVRVGPDFELSLVAGKGLGGRPIDLDWDARGRMWALLRETGGAEWCSIVRLEERDKDGRFELGTVFARGELDMNSMIRHRAGLLVGTESRILFFGDSNGDGAADRPEVLYSGARFRLARRGLDGWVYGVLKPGPGEKERISGKDGRFYGVARSGIFRCRPDGSAFELVSAVENVGGLDFSWDGELFFSGEKHLNQLVVSEEGLGLGTFGALTGVRSFGDHSRNYPEGTERMKFPGGGVGGCAVYEGGAWPEQFHGSYFVAEPTLHSIHEDMISVREGSAVYDATRRTDEDFMRGDSSFVPVDVKVGPDGAMYVLDLYSPAGHGRIWRVQHRRAREQAVPRLDSVDGGTLVEQLGHANRWVRWTAQRLLLEKEETDAASALLGLSRTNRLATLRVHALWGLAGLNALDEASVVSSVTNYHWGVQKNVLRILEDRSDLVTTPVEKVVVEQLKSTCERVRLRALSVLTRSTTSGEVIKGLVDYYPGARQFWNRSLIWGMAEEVPLEFGKVALKSGRSDSFLFLMPHLVREMVRHGGEEDVAELIMIASGQSERKNRLKAGLLSAVNRELENGFTPTWSESYEEALIKLLQTKSRSVQAAALALGFHYPFEEDLMEAAGKALDDVLHELKDEKMKSEDRARLLASLVTVWRLEPRVLRRMDQLLKGNPSLEAQRRLIDALAGLKSAEAGALLMEAYPVLKSELRERAMLNLLKRRNWTVALTEAIAEQKIDANDLGRVVVDRLKNHPDESIARLGRRLFRDRLTPGEGRRGQVLAQIESGRTEPANLGEGKKGFERHCSSCHRVDGRSGRSGPDLGRVSSWSRRDLVRHIIDPRARLAPRHEAIRITMRSGEYYYGLVEDENDGELYVRDVLGQATLPRGDIAKMEGTGQSYMPEGFEELGVEMLRDIAGYLRREGPVGYQTLDLAALATVDSRTGVYQSRVPLLDFRKFGRVTVDGKPYELVDPATLAGGKNLVMLRGGKGVLRELPQRVEIPVAMAVKKFYLLGGVAAWGYPAGPPAGHHVPAARVILRYRDGTEEEFILHNGKEFADVIGPYDVPGSKVASDLVWQGQVRRISIEPKQDETVIDSMVLESFDNHLAPVFVAVTIELKK